MDTLLVVLEPSYKGSIIHLEKDPYAPTSIMGCDKRFAHVIWKSIPVFIGFHTSHLGAGFLLPISRILHRFDRTFYNSTLVIWDERKLFVELPSLKQQKHLKIVWSRPVGLLRGISFLGSMFSSSGNPPWKLTYPLKMGLPKRKVVFQPSIFRANC